jgi:voltage-gated potassium channel
MTATPSARVEARLHAPGRTLTDRLPTWLRPRTDAVNRFVKKHPVLWEGTFALLTVVYLVLGFGGEEFGIAVPDELLLAFAAIFMAEFLLRLWSAKRRMDYVKHHWVDAVTAVPLLGPLRALRLLRLLRLGGVVRLLVLTDHTKKSGGRVSLWFLGPLLLALWAAASYGFWVVEHPGNPHIQSFVDAIQLALVSTLTLGAGEAHPITPEGQVLGGILIFVALRLITFLSSQFTSWILQQRDTNSVVQEEVRGLRDEMTVLRAVIEMHFNAIQGSSEEPG